MTSVQQEIYQSIQYGDHEKLMDIKDSCEDFNFKIHVTINKYYYPVRKAIQKKCLIESDDDDDNDFISPLDKNVEK